TEMSPKRQEELHRERRCATMRDRSSLHDTTRACDRRVMRRRIGLLSLVLCVSVPALAQNLSPQQRQAILDYHLTLPGADHLISAMQAMTKYLVSLPDYQDRMRKSATLTAAERIAQLERSEERRVGKEGRHVRG